MKKLALAFVAAFALVAAAAPLSQAYAQKKLWEGWMEDVKKLQADIAGKMKKK